MPRSLASVILVTAVLLVGVAPLGASASEARPAPAGSVHAAVDSLCDEGRAEAMPLSWLLDLRTVPGPIRTRYDLPPLNELALRCYGDTTLTVTAFAAAPEGLGGGVDYVVDPGWLDTWSSTSRFIAAGDAEAAPGAPAGPFLPIAVPPDLDADFDALAGAWITIQLHFDDAAALGCGVVAPAEPGIGAVPSAADLVELCRQSPVVLSVAAASCPGEAGTIAELVAVPEAIRAHCLGGRSIDFVGRGGSINNLWPGLAIPATFRDWRLSDEAGTDLPVFVPEHVSLPGPAGTPWENRDGVGGPDVEWQVRGHLDDPRSDRCRGGEPVVLEGSDFSVTLRRDDVEAVAFCRNHLVVDSLAWLGAPPTDDGGSGPAPDPGAGVSAWIGPWLALIASVGGALALLIAVRRWRLR